MLALFQLRPNSRTVCHRAALLVLFSAEWPAQRHRNTLYLLVLSLFVLSVKRNQITWGNQAQHTTLHRCHRRFLSLHMHTWKKTGYIETWPRDQAGKSFFSTSSPRYRHLVTVLLLFITWISVVLCCLPYSSLMILRPRFDLRFCISAHIVIICTDSDYFVLAMLLLGLVFTCK